MNPEEAKIKARLEEVLQSIFCPVGGCWCLHGCHYEYYYDEDCHQIPGPRKLTKTSSNPLAKTSDVYARKRTAPRLGNLQFG